MIENDGFEHGSKSGITRKKSSRKIRDVGDRMDISVL
jgi:hypothetical protein